MRIFAVFLLLACGAPFVPVTMSMTDTNLGFVVFAEATKKLNPSCSSSCELGQALEAGGCSDDIVLFRDGGQSCTPGGGWYAPLRGGTFDGGVLAGPPWMIAPGSEVRFLVHASNEPSCAKTISVPAGPLAVSLARVDDGTCTFGTKP